MDPLVLFKALSDATRLRSIVLLATNGELCVCELAYALELQQPKISHHLGALRKAGLVTDRKAGLWTYYCINPRLPGWAQNVIEAAVEGACMQESTGKDRAALESMPDRPGGACCA
ncbi:MAG: metalloregulator ArsR/SmtB family transcription factor [Chromatiales bacterium]|jgi:ArsR family transcriptional regulator